MSDHETENGEEKNLPYQRGGTLVTVHRWPVKEVQREVDGSDTFVQFAGSDQEQLVFEVPAWSLTYRVPDPEAGALLACTCLQRHFEIPLTATLRIVENAGGPSGERS